MMKYTAILLSGCFVILGSSLAQAQTEQEVVSRFSMAMTPHPHQPFLADEARVEVVRDKARNIQKVFLVQEILENGRTPAGCRPPNDGKIDYSEYGPCSFRELMQVLKSLAKRGEASNELFSVESIGEDEALRTHQVFFPHDVQEYFLTKMNQKKFNFSYDYRKQALTVTVELDSYEVAMNQNGKILAFSEIPILYAVPFAGVGLGVANFDMVYEDSELDVISMELLEPWSETVEYSQRP